jgi:Exostosin family
MNTDGPNQDSTLRVYSGPELPPYDKSLNPILRAWCDQRPGLERRAARYEVFHRRFAIATAPQQADVVVAPRFWSPSEAQMVTRLADEADELGLPMVVFAAGDFEPMVPARNAIVLHPGPERSASRPQRTSLALPVFIDDYTKAFPGLTATQAKPTKPRVGFCGQAAARPGAEIVRLRRVVTMQLRARLGRAEYVPPPLWSPVKLRRRALRVLFEDPRIDDRFVVRDQYRAGLEGAHDKALGAHSSIDEFYRNIHDNDYTLCVRGTGNFSQRIYETLCFGRIPIFVNTASALPFEDSVDWRRFCVWVESDELAEIGDRVVNFHEAHSHESFEALQKDCRDLWKSRLSESGFFEHFDDYVSSHRCTGKC